MYVVHVEEEEEEEEWIGTQIEQSGWLLELWLWIVSQLDKKIAWWSSVSYVPKKNLKLDENVLTTS